MQKTPTIEKALADLRKRTYGYGEMTKFAQEIGVSVTFVSDVVHGKRTITDRILDHLGYEWVLRKKKAAPLERAA